MEGRIRCGIGRGELWALPPIGHRLSVPMPRAARVPEVAMQGCVQLLTHLACLSPILHPLCLPHPSFSALYTCTPPLHPLPSAVTLSSTLVHPLYTPCRILFLKLAPLPACMAPAATGFAELLPCSPFCLQGGSLHLLAGTAWDPHHTSLIPSTACSTLWPWDVVVSSSQLGCLHLRVFPWPQDQPGLHPPRVNSSYRGCEKCHFFPQDHHQSS